MPIETDTITGPEWALIYLEYGDDSALTEEEVKLVDQWVEKLKPWRIVGPDSEGDGYSSWFGICPLTGLGTDLVSYVIHKTTKQEDKAK